MVDDLRTTDDGHRNPAPRPAALALLAAAGLGAGLAAAQAPSSPDGFEPGFYVGAEIGGMSFDNACDPSALSCDHADTAAAAFAGYRFGSRFMAEIGMRDLGEALAVYPRLTTTVDMVGEIDGYELSAVMRLPFRSDWEAYLRGGAYHWDAETRSPQTAIAESGWSPSAGAGLAWRFRPAWQARFQFLYIVDIGGVDTGKANVEMLSAGVSYFFGSRGATAACRPVAQ
jgi:OOP family OmpA-OmpF porin